jgi:hypothetical protein
VAERIRALLDEFAARRAAGERPDPVGYLERAGDEAPHLAALIDALAAAGTPPPEPSGALVAMMDAVAEGEPPLLGARLHRGLRVDAVAGALVDGLGLPAGSRAKVRRLYQRLEGGLLDPSRLDRRLVAVLARALGIGDGDVALAGSTPVAVERAYLRLQAEAPPSDLLVADLAVPAEPGEPDEVDRLFGLA